MSKDEYPEEIQQAINCLRGEGRDNEACAIMEYIDTQTSQIAALKEIAINERAKRNHPWSFPDKISCSINDAIVIRAQDEAKEEARKQLEAEYEVMRK